MFSKKPKPPIEKTLYRITIHLVDKSTHADIFTFTHDPHDSYDTSTEGKAQYICSNIIRFGGRMGKTFYPLSQIASVTYEKIENE